MPRTRVIGLTERDLHGSVGGRRRGVKMSTTTREIDKAEWLSCLNELSKQYQGWWATIEVLGRELGDVRVADGVPLQGLSFEPQGSEAGAILIEVGDWNAAFMIHHVDAARGLWIADTLPGDECDIHISSENGIETLVRLRRPGTAGE